jgi:hypothetical protein
MKIRMKPGLDASTVCGCSFGLERPGEYWGPWGWRQSGTRMPALPGVRHTGPAASDSHPAGIRRGGAGGLRGYLVGEDSGSSAWHRLPDAIAAPATGRSAGRLVLIALALLIIIAALGLTLLSLIELRGGILRLASIIVPVLIVAAATLLSVGDRLDRN